MLTEEKKGILKVLVAFAWADGRVAEEEMEIVEALLDAFEAGEDEAGEIREWARTERSLEDVDVSGLTPDDVEIALRHAVLLTYIDGEQSPEEIALVGDFASRLGLSADDAAPILESADAFARDLLPELEA